ncbi:MAG: glycosyltransferase family 39 protein [Alphaproteobacteria bacterium]|nr:glycosyltransferase family 39 protein [Alphaproteobacteria bacterium]
MVGVTGRFRLDALSMGGLGACLSLLSLPGLRALPWKHFVHELGKGSRWLTLLLLLVCLSSFLQGLAPPNDYDSLMYHLAVPKSDIERGFIAPDWARGMPHAMFPDLVGNLSRFALALAGEQAAQPMAALLGMAATCGAGLLAIRVGLSTNGALLAALIFASVRAVVWEMGTVEVDVPLAASAAAALIVLLASRPHPKLGLMLLLGIMLGIGFNTKYQGGLVAVALALIPVYDWMQRKTSFAALVVMGASALVVFAPHMYANWSITGNPVFPMVNKIFVPDGVAFYQDYNLTYGTGRNFVDFLMAPWTLSIAPMQLFDGMVLGAPVFMALMPGLLASRKQLTNLGPIFAFVVGYFALWFYVQPQQVRFLIPATPALSALAGAGALCLWQASKTSAAKRLGVICVFLLLGLNEAMFVGIYSLLRLPAALGFVSPLDYHAKTPTLQGANYATCVYITENLKPGERYLSLLGPHSYYCPQIQTQLRYFKDEERDWLWDKPRHKIGFTDFLARLEKQDIRFVIVPVAGENRRNDTGAPVSVAIDFNESRFGPFIEPAIRRLTPVATERFSAVYDGAQVLKAMRDMHSSGDYAGEAR